MNLGQLAWRNIKGNAFRSWVVFLCAMVVAGFSLSAVMIIRGAEDSLRLALNRLGADIIVVPEGTETRVETALLMGKPVKVWMPQENLDKIARIPGWPWLLHSSISRPSPMLRAVPCPRCSWSPLTPRPISPSSRGSSKNWATSCAWVKPSAGAMCSPRRAMRTSSCMATLSR